MEAAKIKDAGGLSPPTRGNRRARTSGDLGDGSIPAHAGEPRRSSSAEIYERLYPRPRGGTALVFTWAG